MKKIHHCLLIGSFCLFLIFLPVSGALFRIVSGPAQSDENRPLKAFPPIRTTDDLDAFPDRFSGSAHNHERPWKESNFQHRIRNPAVSPLTYRDMKQNRLRT